MKPVTLNQQSQAIVYDGDLLPGADAALFDAELWRARGRLRGSAPGRGTAHFIDMDFGPAVLRRYLRGGWVARFNTDRYRFTTVERSRPFREFELLGRMAENGLRVPAPVAALCDREGRHYRGALITRRIQPARALAERLDDPELDWERLGAELREFHEAGMDHADLNARNILVHDDTGAAWLLDLDRGRFTPGSPVDGRRNLARLLRSMRKLWPGQGTPAVAFERLSRGYGT